MRERDGRRRQQERPNFDPEIAKGRTRQEPGRDPRAPSEDDDRYRKALGGVALGQTVTGTEERTRQDDELRARVLGQLALESDDDLI